MSPVGRCLFCHEEGLDAHYELFTHLEAHRAAVEQDLEKLRDMVHDLKVAQWNHRYRLPRYSWRHDGR